MSQSTADEAEVKPAKPRTAPFRMKVIRDLRKAQESNEKEEEELPHILTIKEWVRLKKKREKEAKKSMKKESQLQYVTVTNHAALIVSMLYSETLSNKT